MQTTENRKSRHKHDEILGRIFMSFFFLEHAKQNLAELYLSESIAGLKEILQHAI
jgi:hypothetical protein